MFEMKFKKEKFLQAESILICLRIRNRTNDLDQRRRCLNNAYHLEGTFVMQMAS